MLVAAALVLAASFVVAGCGGSGSSGSSAERAKLSSQVAAQLKGTGIPADLADCVSRQSKGLPLAQLRNVASAGSNPDPATKHVAIDLVTTCIRQGKGISALRALIVEGVNSSASASLPPSFTKCIVAKADAVSPSEISQLISAYANQNQATAVAQARQVGVGLARQCFRDPSVLLSLRAVFIAPIKTAFAQRSYSAAFKSCVLKKAEQFPTSELEQASLHPGGSTQLGEAFGRNAARACIAAGAKP